MDAPASASASGRSPSRSPSPCSPCPSRTPSVAGSSVPPAGCPLTALTFLHSCSISPSTLDTVRCYQPWCSVRGVRADQGDEGRAERTSVPPGGGVRPSTMYSAALCGLGGRVEDSFPTNLAIQMPLPLPLALPGGPRRPRSEKKPTPEDQKDQRYLERRRRNNRAAKKSRDARRAREDQVALRAALLEHENAVLRAQVMTLREETHSLRQLLIHGKGLLPLQGCREVGDMPRI